MLPAWPGPIYYAPLHDMLCYVTKWRPYRGKHIHRLVCYIWSTLDYMQEGHIAQSDVNSLQGVAYSDADFAGCLGTQRSTTGGHLCIEGNLSHCPIHSMSTLQDATASSTPDADIVAAGTVLRHMLVPRLDILGSFTSKGTQ